MKTKAKTRQRKQERDYDVAMKDCNEEFGSSYNDYDVIDELALAEIEEDE